MGKYTPVLSFSPSQFLGQIFSPDNQSHTGTNVEQSVNTNQTSAEPRSAVGRASDVSARGPGFDTRSGHILLFLLPPIQEGRLSVTGESMYTKYWLTA